MTRPLRLPAALLASLLLSALLAACSSGTQPSASPSPSMQQLTAEQVTVANAGTPQTSVSFAVPSQAPSLSTRDLKPGEGPGATVQSQVTVNYVGVGAITGEVFDSSFSLGTPATFSLARVIPGWTQGMTGMKAGGERVLVIPGDLAYGPTPPAGAGILPNETLVFYVQLVSFKG